MAVAALVSLPERDDDEGEQYVDDQRDDGRHDQGLEAKVARQTSESANHGRYEPSETGRHFTVP